MTRTIRLSYNTIAYWRGEYFRKIVQHLAEQPQNSITYVETYAQMHMGCGRGAKTH